MANSPFTREMRHVHGDGGHAGEASQLEVVSSHTARA